jgi:hypothetical protein
MQSAAVQTSGVGGARLVTKSTAGRAAEGGMLLLATERLAGQVKRQAVNTRGLLQYYERRGVEGFEFGVGVTCKPVTQTCHA